MKELLMGIACLCSINLLGQIDYFEANPEWRVDASTLANDCVMKTYRSYVLDGDSMHSNGYEYQKMKRKNYQVCEMFFGVYSEPPEPYYNENDEHLIRQEGKKIFIHNGWADTLLYDFDLQIGDTLPTTYNYYGNATFPDTIVAIDSIETSTGWRNRFYTSSSEIEYLIEGIGHPWGFLEHLGQPLSVSTSFVCYSQNGEVQFDAGVGQCEFDILYSPVDNNDCQNATDISHLINCGPTQFSQIYSNVGASSTSNDPVIGWDCFEDIDSSGVAPSLDNTLWFRMDSLGKNVVPFSVGSFSMEIKTTNCGDSILDYLDQGNSQLALYKGDCLNLEPINCNEDGLGSEPDDRFGQIFFNGASPEYYSDTFYLMIDGHNSMGNLSQGEFCLQIDVSCVVGLEEYESSELQLFPNPSKDKVYLDLEDEQFSSVQIFNALGQKQFVGINVHSNQLELDVSDLQKGLYFIHLKNDGFYSGRFIKD